MREIPTEFQTALDSGATTLARCWKVTRWDGAVLGFTNHDRALSFDGTSYEPESGFSPTAVEVSTGLSSDTHDVTGMLSSNKITATDIANGLYDRAEVTLYLVNWQNPNSHVLVSRGLVGEIRTGEQAFEAEIIGLSEMLSQPVGRAYLHSCACRLGEAKCGVDLGLPANKGTGTIDAITEAQQFTAAGLSGFAEGWFTGGEVLWTSGANQNLRSHVKAHLAASGETVVELWLAPPQVVLVGDSFEITAGCDKTMATCAAKFGNTVNFRGFPHIPGDDVAASYPNTGGAHDGGSLFRS